MCFSELTLTKAAVFINLLVSIVTNKFEIDVMHCPFMYVSIIPYMCVCVYHTVLVCNLHVYQIKSGLIRNGWVDMTVLY